MGEGPGSPHGDALRLPPPPPPPPPPGAYELNAVAFMRALEAGLTGKAAGYAIGLNAGGVTIQQATGGWAQVPFDGTGPSGLPWTLDTRMFVASLNKILTAISMTKLLAEAGMSPDTPIIGYLPAYWVKGVNVDEITFANLLAHTSGLGDGSSRMDYSWMKAQIESGAPTLGASSYQNVNYGLCRVLLAAVRGNVPPGFLVWPSQQIDLIWDSATINAYASYMAAEVFAPSGVHGPDFTFDPTYALGIRLPGDERLEQRAAAGAGRLLHVGERGAPP